MTERTLARIIFFLCSICVCKCVCVCFFSFLFSSSLQRSVCFLCACLLCGRGSRTTRSGRFICKVFLDKPRAHEPHAPRTRSRRDSDAPVSWRSGTHSLFAQARRKWGGRQTRSQHTSHNIHTHAVIHPHRSKMHKLFARACVLCSTSTSLCSAVERINEYALVSMLWGWLF